jgi:hypothetical protein
MGDIIGGTFVQHFDKKGKPTTTDDTVLGVTYKNETQQQFAERLQSANYLAVLDKMGSALPSSSPLCKAMLTSYSPLCRTSRRPRRTSRSTSARDSSSWPWARTKPSFQ